jgi:hypothetical protein
MKIYLVPQMVQVKNLINSLGALALADVQEALVLDITDVESAGAVTRLFEAIDQPFDIIHPPAPALLREQVAPDWAPESNFHMVDLRPDEVAQARLKPYHTPELRVIDDLRHDLEAAQPVEPVDSAMVEDMPAVMPVITEPKPGKLVLKEVLTGIEIVCTHCGDTWRARRKDMRYCPKPECQAVKKETYKKAWRERYHNSLNKTGLMSDVIIPEMHEEQPQPLPEEPEKVIPLISNETEVSPDVVTTPATVELKHWIFDNGKGVDFLSTSQVKSMLADGVLRVGQKLRHTRIGDCKVVKRTQGKGLALLRWYGTESPMMVDFSDPIYA